MLDALAAAIGLVWDLGILALLWRFRHRGALFIVVSFALVSLYTADRMLPRVLVDAWPNFDAARSPAMRPWFVLPDLVLLVALVARARFPISRGATLIIVTLGVATLLGLVISATQDAIPLTAALFWATVPVRGMLVIALVDSIIRHDGAESSAAQVVTASMFGAGVLAVELLGVTALQSTADMLGYDLASIWSGFDWVRPNLPGWNNNVAASAISFGAAAAILMPDRGWLPDLVRRIVVVLSALALLAAEYRTAIIVFIAAVAIRVAIEVFRRMRPRFGSITLAPAIGAAVLAALILLGAAAAAVPRLADINPIAYVGQTVGDASLPDEEPIDPTDETDTSSLTRASILKATLTVWLRNPIAGPGLGAWEFDRPTEPTFLQKAITPHNGYAWALADLGLIGFAGFYLIPALLVLFRRPPFALLVWVLLLAVLEVSIVGIAHSRYAVLYWAALGVVALAPWRLAPARGSSTKE